MNEDAAVGLHHLIRSAPGDPYAAALLAHIRQLEASQAAPIPPGPCSAQGGCTCPPDPEEQTVR